MGSTCRWVVVLGFCFAAQSFTICAQAGEKVKLSLNWVPEPEFGGIYAAQQNGNFAKHGLDVEIVPGGAGTPTWQLVAGGKAQFAVASADEVIIARQRGQSKGFRRQT